MTDPSKIKLSHTQRAAYVYVRLSTPGQVEHNRPGCSVADSNHRRGALAHRATSAGGVPAYVGGNPKLGVSRQTVLHRVKRGELQAVLVRQGRRKGLRIKVVDQRPALFEQLS